VPAGRVAQVQAGAGPAGWGSAGRVMVGLLLTGPPTACPGARGRWSQSDAARKAVGPAVDRAARHTAFHAPVPRHPAPVRLLPGVRLACPVGVPRPTVNSAGHRDRRDRPGDGGSHVCCVPGGPPFVPADLRPRPYQQDGGGQHDTGGEVAGVLLTATGRKPEPLQDFRQARWPAPAATSRPAPPSVPALTCVQRDGGAPVRPGPAHA
jgi:hypothetical protein